MPRRQVFFLGVLLFCLTLPIAAQVQNTEVPEIVSVAAVVLDAATGTIIYSKNPDMEIPPASLTKLMTMHLAFREVREGRASMDEIIEPTSESWARNQLPLSSLMHLAPGQRLSLRELFLGLAIFSGNDASAAMALHFAPTVDIFVEMMNLEARAMGLSRTHFADPSGYSELNMTTAREFAEFSRLYLEANPNSLMEFHAVREFAYPRPENVAGPYQEEPNTRIQRNRNTLLGRVEGVDGLKTGSIPAAGFNIAVTAERDRTRFIAVTLGAPHGWGGDRIRDDDVTRLIEWSFDNYITLRPELENPEPVRVWKGKINYVNIVWGAPLYFTALKERGDDLNWHIEKEDHLIAPLPALSQVGSLVINDRYGELRRIPILTAQEVERGGFFKRLFDTISLFFLR